MSERLRTLATFGSPVEANLARNRLEAAGIQAFLADEETVGMAWHLTNAIGGVRLQVANRDAEEALAILAETNASGLLVPEQTEAASPQRSDAEQLLELGGGDLDEPEPVPTSREQNAERAFRGAVFGLLVLPLQLYVFWLLLKVFVSDARLGPAQRHRALAPRSSICR